MVGDDATDLLALAARSQLERAIEAVDAGRLENAIAEFSEIETRFAGEHRPGVREVVAEAIFGRARALEGLGRIDESIAAYDEVIVQFGLEGRTEIQMHVALAMNNRAILLWRRGDRQDSLATFRELVDRFGRWLEPEMEELVLDALDSMRVIFIELGQPDAALAVSDELLDRPSGENLSSVSLRLRALMFQGVEFQQRKKFDHALRAFDTVIDLSARHRGESVLDEYVAWAYTDKAAVLVEEGQYDEARSTVEAAEQRFSGRSEPEIQVALASARVNKGHALRELGRLRQSLVVYEGVMKADVSEDHDKGLEIGRSVATAEWGAGVALEEAERLEDAAELYAGLIARFDKEEDLAIVEIVAQALLRRGAVLAQLGHGSEANKIFDEVVRRFDGASSEALRDVVKNARARRRRRTPRGRE